MAGWIDELEDALVSEFECVGDLSVPGSIDRHDNTRKKQQGLFQTVGKEGTLSAILLAERFILNFELEFYGNSQAMRSSIKDALADMTITERLIRTVQDPAAYQAVNQSHARPKNRVGGLPRDEARQFFRAHWTRLLNLDKGRLDRLDKDILDARRTNIRTAEKDYIVLQQIALGITPQPPDKARGAGLDL